MQVLKNAGLNICPDSEFQIHAIYLEFLSNNPLVDEELPVDFFDCVRPLVITNQSESKKFDAATRLYAKRVNTPKSVAADKRKNTSRNSRKSRITTFLVAVKKNPFLSLFIVWFAVLLLGYRVIAGPSPVETPPPVEVNQLEVTTNENALEEFQTPLKSELADRYMQEVKENLDELSQEDPNNKTSNFAWRSHYLLYGISFIFLIFVYIIRKRNKFFEHFLRQVGGSNPEHISSYRSNFETVDQLQSNSIRRAYKKYSQYMEALEGPRLDISASVNATAKASGIFVPINLIKRREQKYVFLIDARSVNDSYVYRVKKYIETLKELNFDIECLFFEKSPDRVRQDMGSKSHPFSKVKKKYSDRRFIVFSDLGFLIDPNGLTISNSLSDILSLGQVILITIKPMNYWGLEEQILSSNGLTISPFSAANLVECLLKLSMENTFVKHSNKNNIKFPPSFITRNREKLLTDVKPPKSFIETLQATLMLHLGYNGWRLACACAVFPVLLPELTDKLQASLGATQTIEFATREKLLNRLLVLPWFREGFFPNWIREFLIDSMNENDKRVVRELIYEYLQKLIGEDKKADTEDNVISILSGLHSSGDEIFVEFAYGKQKPLDFKLPINLPPVKRQRKIFKHLGNKFFYRTAISLLFICVTFTCAGVFLLQSLIKDLPTTEQLLVKNKPISIQFIDRYGRKIGDRGARYSGTGYDLKQIPKFVSESLLAVEDKYFYDHGGIDIFASTRALYVNWKVGGGVTGGSTITQQLAKNLFLTPDMTVRRKVQELLIAVRIERNFSKEDILKLYFDRVYFGNGIWGLGEASGFYFGKRPSNLTITETAMLIGALKAPSRYNPYVRLEESAKRTAQVLHTMQSRGVISKTDLELALLNGIEFRPLIHDGKNDYFLDWLFSQIESEQLLSANDLIIQTTLDADLQQSSNEAVLGNIDPQRNATQAATVTINGDGGVLAMIGGTSYEASQFNRATGAKRQLGSAFMPFVIEAAFNSGLNPGDVRIDEPISIGDWEPSNFSEKFFGELTLEQATALSINSIAISLTEEVGRKNVIEVANSHGLTEILPLRSLALGSQASSLLELTTAYLPYANFGQYIEPYGILSVATSDGVQIYERPKYKGKRIITSKTLGHINEVLKTSVNQGTGRRAQIPNRDVAGKTGTTSEYRDAWFVGYVPNMVTGVWVGSDDYSPMYKVTGGSIPASVWKDAVYDYVNQLPNAKLPISETTWIKQDLVLENLLNEIEASLSED